MKLGCGRQDASSIGTTAHLQNRIAETATESAMTASMDITRSAPNSHAHVNAMPMSVLLSELSPADSKYLLGWCMRFTRNEEDAKDLMQATLIKALSANFEGRCALRTWLCFIARTQFLMQLRLQRTKIRLREADAMDGIELLDPRESQQTVLMREQCLERVRRAVSQLPRRYREVITLFWLEERSGEETAAKLNLSVGAVKSYLFRARALLKKRLTQ
jgi:RNA polymerase sigma factor (sigma-70 family)